MIYATKVLQFGEMVASWYELMFGPRGKALVFVFALFRRKRRSGRVELLQLSDLKSF